MQNEDLPNQGIVISQKHLLLLLLATIFLLFFVGIVGLDGFILWAFWNHYGIDTGAYVAALICAIATVFYG